MKLFDCCVQEPNAILNTAWCGIVLRRDYTKKFFSSLNFYIRSPFSKHSRYVDPHTMDFKEGQCSFFRHLCIRFPLRAVNDNNEIVTIYKWPRLFYYKTWVNLPE